VVGAKGIAQPVFTIVDVIAKFEELLQYQHSHKPMEKSADKAVALLRIMQHENSFKSKKKPSLRLACAGYVPRRLSLFTFLQDFV
jgi:hypothetical protein